MCAVVKSTISQYGRFKLLTCYMLIKENTSLENLFEIISFT